MATIADIKTKCVPAYCQTATTKEIAEMLNISTDKAYKLCCEAEAEGWLSKFGYINPKEPGNVYSIEEIGNNKPPRGYSLTWQNVEEK